MLRPREDSFPLDTCTRLDYIFFTTPSGASSHSQWMEGNLRSLTRGSTNQFEAQVGDKQFKLDSMVQVIWG